ncbi:MAG TPA: hypothetical protein DIU15_13905 [Deltaproteobacteria bacterium]|nr:hypothetical protein [Deltaproteobacteria bacterium]|tara:strand:- start:123 stop:728 length:606 start_codon:yes stop_codon:yes gene_type:complete
MTRIKLFILAVFLLATQNVFAHGAKDAPGADYHLSVSVSPFGGSLNFAHHISPKTTYMAAIGGLPGLEMDLKIDGTDYTVDTSSSWVGFFVNHRPIESASWFRVVAGIGIGSIENELTDDDGNRYKADYNDNPVGYLGVGFGAGTDKGFTIAFDLGLLNTSGPDVSQVEGAANQDAVESISGHFFFGNVMPNLQLSLGWNF